MDEAAEPARAQLFAEGRRSPGGAARVGTPTRGPAEGSRRGTPLLSGRPFYRVVARLAIAWAIAALLGVAATAAAAEQTRNVLVLYSWPRMQPANVEGDRGLHEAIRTTTDRPVLVFDESLDAPRFGGQEYEKTVIAYLQEKYASRPPDVIVAVGPNSVDFLLRHRVELFTQVPIVHVGLTPEVLRSIPALPAQVVGVAMEVDYAATIDLALRWHPKARRLIIVTGSTTIDRQLEAEFRAVARRFAGRATVEFLAALPMPEVLQRLGGLGPDAVVFTSGFYGDGANRSFVPRDTVAAMAAASTAPVYAPFSSLMGTGIVGGCMTTFESIGRQAGEIVNELLAGATPGSLDLPPVMRQVVNVDWRQIRRWGIPEGAILKDAIVHFRPPPLLEAYPNDVLVAVLVALLQAALIARLVVERHRRRRAEAARDVQRQELAHASRLAIAGELTASIAHEINQPLGAILSNADAADLILESHDDWRDEIRSILADIRRDDRRASEVVRQWRRLLAKHTVEPRPFDLNGVVRDVESLLRAEARRRGVALRIQPAPTPAETTGDPVQIQQVLINVVLNAMDAVAGLPDDRRTITVPVESDDGHVTILVRDRGHGIPPADLPRLFEPFFSTKREGMGLGLAITRSLVESHGGRIWAENGPADGAVVHIELPPVPRQDDARPEPE